MKVDAKESRLLAIEMLEEEHRLIMRMVKLLPMVQRRVEGGSRLPEVLMTIVDFFQIYTDKSHHAKEEAALFPLLAKRGIRLEGCPIGTLHHEHEQGRVLMKTLRAAVQSYSEGDPDAKKQIAQALNNASGFYTEHIWKEDFLLFPLSRKVLNDSDEEELRKQFISIDSKMGHRFQDEYHYHVDRVEAIVNSDGNIVHPYDLRAQTTDTKFEEELVKLATSP